VSRAAGFVLLAAGCGAAGFSLVALLKQSAAATPGPTPPPAKTTGPATTLPRAAVTPGAPGGFDMSPCSAKGAYKLPACVTAYQGGLSYLSSVLGKPAWAAPATGKLDPATTAAVKAFQGANPPLKVDGEAGKETTAAISALIAANPPTVAAPAAPQAVATTGAS
jgi:putative peptidoglycan binding protein